jgi:transposase
MATQMPEQDPKLEALRQQGTLNPRPGEVTDELFVEDSFFDSRDLVQVKYEMLRRVQAEGKAVSGAAAAFGFSRPSFYQAQAAFGQDGLAGLVPHKRGPKQAHKLTEEVLAILREARQLDPTVRAGELARLVQQRFGTTVNPRSIERALSHHQKKLR